MLGSARESDGISREGVLTRSSWARAASAALFSRPHIGPICHCCLLDPALHFSAMILLPFFVPDAATQSPSPFWIVISLPLINFSATTDSDSTRRALMQP